MQRCLLFPSHLKEIQMSVEKSANAFSSGGIFVVVLVSLTLMPHFTCLLPEAIGQHACSLQETMNKKLQ